MTYSLTRRRTDGGYRYEVTDAVGRVIGTREAQRSIQGAVVVASEMSDLPSVWSWHPTSDAATLAAGKLHRSRPEMIVSAATA